MRLLVSPLVWVSFLLACGTASNTIPQNSDSAVAAPQEVRELEQTVEIPPGVFVYGVSEDDFQLLKSTFRMNYPGLMERVRAMQVTPPQPVDLPAFLIGEFEVSNRQFSEFIEESGYRAEKPVSFLKHWTDGRYPDWAADFPVVWVSATDAQAYCRWRGGRLPSDSEWEKAARGNQGLAFPWGDRFPDPETSNIGTDRLEPVGNRPGDRSPYEVYDLGGNVAELTSTRLDFGGRSVHTVRGGSYQSGLNSTFAFQRFLGLGPDERAENIGFRCAYAKEGNSGPTTGRSALESK